MPSDAVLHSAHEPGPSLALQSPELLVLHALRVKGYVEPPFLASTTGLDEAEVMQALRAAQATGQAAYKDGRVRGWTLTAAGRAAHADMARAALDPASQDHAALATAYQGFLELNGPMKALCTRWQLENQPPALVDALAELDAQVGLVLTPLAPLAPRFAVYRARFDAAMARLRSGQTDAFLRPLSDSYHDVWMELHQDLLLTLGRTRSEDDGH